VSEAGHRHLRRRLQLLGVLLLVLLALSIAWSWGPLREWLNVDRIVGGLRGLGQEFGPVAAVAGFTVALVVGVPFSLLTLVCIVAFGPVEGSIYTLVGGALGSAASYGVGHALGREAVRRMAGPRVNEVSERLGRRGFAAGVAVRLVPIAPFAVVNMIAGSSHIRFRDFQLGSMIGMVPGTVLAALFVDRLLAAVQEPGPDTLILAVVVLLLVVTGAWAARRWLGREDHG
jgi:uncharacterized membrane protein YdjX (TVP38/TMEM64 family)